MIKKEDTRVLMRKGARDLTLEEVQVVRGALGTTTKCSITVDGKIDGDLHECM